MCVGLSLTNDNAGVTRWVVAQSCYKPMFQVSVYEKWGIRLPLRAKPLKGSPRNLERITVNIIYFTMLQYWYYAIIVKYCMNMTTVLALTITDTALFKSKTRTRACMKDDTIMW